MERNRTARPALAQSPRLRDAAVVLPLLGLFAWMPPLIGLFTASGRVLGVPLIVAWLFGIWLVLIIAAFWFSRRLDIEDELDPDDATTALERSDRAGIPGH